MSLRGGCLALLLAVAGCASAPVIGAEGKAVEAEGRGADSERALVDALKRAVEKALGVSLAASTRVEAAVAVRRRIWADARGRVESWSVLSERVEDGLRVVRVRAMVRRLADDEMIPPPDGAKVRIMGTGPATAGLRRGFGARGFSVVERGEDFVVTARADSALLRDVRTAPFVSALGRVSVSVVDAATGGVVWEQAREAGGLDSDSLAAAARAVDGAGELGGRDAADGLSRILWNR